MSTTTDEPDRERLRAAYAAGDYVEAGVGSSRRLQFADGSLWFPDGLERAGSHTVALPLLFGLVLVTLVATIVALADGSGYWWCFGLGLVVVTGALAMVLRAALKVDDTALARLEVGIFLLRDRAVLESGSGTRTIARDDVTEFRVRQGHRGGGKSNPWVYFVVTRARGEELVATDMRARAELLEVLRAWQRGDGAAAAEPDR